MAASPASSDSVSASYSNTDTTGRAVGSTTQSGYSSTGSGSNLLSTILGIVNNTTNQQNTSYSNNNSQNSNASTTNTTDESTTTSDPEAIAEQKAILDQAIAASNNSSATDAIVQNILNQSAIAFTGTKGAAKSTGLYNSTTLGQLQTQAEGAATAQSASAVLNYQTTEQQIADQASANLLNATKTTSGGSSAATSGVTNTNNQIGATSNNQQQSGTSSSQNTSTVANALQDYLFGNSGGSISNNQSNSQNESVSGDLGTIICTELMVQGKFTKWEVARMMVRFNKIPTWCKDGYHFWARPVVLHLREHPCSFFSLLVYRLFNARKNGSKVAAVTVAAISMTCGSYLLARKWVSLPPLEIKKWS